MCDVTHHESFGLGLTAVNEIRKHIYFILDDRFFFFCGGSLAGSIYSRIRRDAPVTNTTWGLHV